MEALENNGECERNWQHTNACDDGNDRVDVVRVAVGHVGLSLGLISSPSYSAILWVEDSPDAVEAPNDSRLNVSDKRLDLRRLVEEVIASLKLHRLVGK